MDDQDQCIIIVAEDDEGDRFLIEKSMRDCGIDRDVQFVADGQALVERLAEASGDDREFALPCLILMDLNMPRMDGREVLRALKRNARLKEIPIVVLTNSSNPDDVSACYRDGASSFFTKPMGYRELVGLMSLLKAYWFQTAELPHPEN